MHIYLLFKVTVYIKYYQLNPYIIDTAIMYYMFCKQMHFMNEINFCQKKMNEIN